MSAQPKLTEAQWSLVARGFMGPRPGSNAFPLLELRDLGVKVSSEIIGALVQQKLLTVRPAAEPWVTIKGGNAGPYGEIPDVELDHAYELTSAARQALEQKQMTELNDAMVEVAALRKRIAGPLPPRHGAHSLGTQEIFWLELTLREREILTAALAILPEAEQGWQPILAAPFQKTVIVGKAGTALRVTAYRMGENSYWRHVHTSEQVCFEPTHWRPLPPPPPAEGGQKG